MDITERKEEGRRTVVEENRAQIRGDMKSFLTY
jgi:hypothetical protein